MELLRISFATTAVMTFLLALVFPAINAHSPAPAPALAPSSDGVAIDQGIAYVLMLAALVLTYIIH